jgi:crotonobetainyl-CoA:carnitine CoA-transferase CaiB-like acyl-CoA transferase
MGGRAELTDLVMGADVFLQNWRPGRSEQWGLAYPDLAARNPQLVYAEASGFGRVPGPHPMGTDFMVQAYAGVGNGINPEGTRPFPSRALLVDYLGGLVACEGILEGLLRREQSGQGCLVETSLLAAAMTLQFPSLVALTSGNEQGRRQGRPLWGLLDEPVETADGLLALSVEGNEARVRLCQILDVDGTRLPPQETERLLVERIRSQATSSAQELLSAGGIASAAVCTDLATLPTDPHIGCLFEPLGGTSRVPAAPWRFSA